MLDMMAWTRRARPALRVTGTESRVAEREDAVAFDVGGGAHADGVEVAADEFETESTTGFDAGVARFWFLGAATAGSR